MTAVDEKVRCFRVENLSIEVHPSRKALGAAAALAAAEAMKHLGASMESFAVIFATGASQLETLESLTRIEGIPWDRVQGFHMDEYVGLPIEHVASFRRYLREKLTQKVQMRAFNEVDGTTADLDQFCRVYAEKLATANPKLCLLGIGENGHLAFMDPAVADFKDPRDVKVVRLDAACRAQQVTGDGSTTSRRFPSARSALPSRRCSASRSLSSLFQEAAKQRSCGGRLRKRFQPSVQLRFSVLILTLRSTSIRSRPLNSKGSCFRADLRLPP